MHPFPFLASSLGKIFQPFFDAMAWVLAGFYAVIPNYAVDIILLTIAVMAITAPLTIKSTRSMAAMTKLQPKMKELQKKYKHDKVKLNEEMMALYRENGVSPLGGCIPMLIQFPVFIVLYEVINGLTNTKKLPDGQLVAIPRYIGHQTAMYADLVKHPGVMKSFGINLADTVFSGGLSGVERIPYIVLILLAIGLQYLQMHQMTKRNGGSQTNPQMQAVQKFMPIIFAVIYLRISAGVNVYFVTSSVARIGLQTLAYRKMPEADSGRVGRIGEAKPGRKTLMERLADAQQRALEQQRALQQGGVAPGGEPDRGRDGAARNGTADAGAGGGQPRRGGPGRGSTGGGPGGGGQARSGSAGRGTGAGGTGGAAAPDRGQGGQGRQRRPGTGGQGAPPGGGARGRQRPATGGESKQAGGRPGGSGRGARPGQGSDGLPPSKRTRKAP